MKPRILIVDDDEKNVILLTVKMEKEGYEVEKATNGLDALDKVSSCHPDLILMDVMMPKMDGYEALRRLKSKEETRYIPVIMLTGLGEIEDKVTGFEVGAEDYIVKPFSLREVSARVKALLRMRALQAKLRDTEKMAALGGMVDGIAHEVRNPLTAMGGMARRLYDHETDPQHKKYAQGIIKSVERLERMMQRIDEYKSILVSRLARGDINKVITDTIEDVKDLFDGKDIEIKTALMPEPPPVRMDYGNMKIALFNILQNSVDAIEKKGEIKVETLPYMDDTIVVRITDNGVGIEEEDLRQIFSPFQTSKPQGAGLGLTITYRIILDHGGDISVHSRKGEGTVVTIKLHPVLERASEEPLPVKAQPVGEGVR
ncbi:MAG TPA: response regulator [Thermodesulfobacteriota bacterium]|nr:response regulator [Thermodesulfobacteriota bacterium]